MFIEDKVSEYSFLKLFLRCMSAKASKIFMVRPVKFGYNEQTAASNSFQNYAPEIISENIQQQALQEFNLYTDKLIKAGIEVIIFNDTLDPHTPDSIFPNNWISFHENNSMVIYPMLAENRRQERRKDIIDYFSEKNSVIDLSSYENEGIILEGTGSIVFDYDHRLAFANISPRTDLKLLNELCTTLGYTAITFTAVDSEKNNIYHTNVVMCIGNNFAVLCKECILDPGELKRVIESLEKSGHEIIEISSEQMNFFAGNMYQLFNDKKQSIIVMSEQAYHSLMREQTLQLEKHGMLLYSPLYTIEKYGGGSARCMIADVR
jgi:hypothetical protein